jgi:uncharacterized protein YuzE
MSRLNRMTTVVLVLVVSLLVVPTVLGQDMTPSVTVEDQRIEDGTVTVGTVVSDGPGWIVIHNQEDGQPGAVIGQAAVTDGENMDVEVEIDVSQATETLYAMLHTDDGEEGTYEFPDGDAPVEVDGEVVLESFMITGGMRGSVMVEDQEIMDGMVTIAEVVSDGPGWIVIHADDGGQPGPVIGQTALTDGMNEDVEVEIDMDGATETLYAMLHEDTGEEGTYEFPDGDAPVVVDGEVVVQAFMITGGMEMEEEEEEATATPAEEEDEEEEEAVLPQTGTGGTAGLVLALMVGGILALAAGLLLQRLSARKARIDD